MAAAPLRILHLEDNSADAHLAREHLAQAGITCEIRRVETRGEFLAALEGCGFDVIFADYQLPGFDGLTAFEIAQERCPAIPFIIVTGQMGEEFAIDTLKRGVTDYVLKGRMARLAPAVRRALAEVEERRRRALAEEDVRRYQQNLEALVHARTAELEQANRSLAAANRDLESFVSSASHDLRTPLVIIGGFAKRLLAEDAYRLDDRGLQMLRSVVANADRMEHLLNDLMDFFRVSMTVPRRSTVPMESLVREVFDELASLCAQRQIRLAVAPLPDADGDPAMVRLVLVNLLSNAIKYSCRREVATVEVSGRTDDREVRYQVKDNGVGFDLRQEGKLFELFQRLHDKKDYPGTGMGLAIVKRIVEKHGGSVFAESTPGEGATFAFTLPRARG